MGLGYDEAYLEACASIMFESSHRGRHRIKWDSSSLAIAHGGVERFDFLKGYSYEDR